MRTTRNSFHASAAARSVRGRLGEASRPSCLLSSDLRPHTAPSLRSAFTLIEMLIVISIISVLLGLLYGALERAQKFTRRTITYTELKSVESAFKQYYAHYHTWPSNTVAEAKLVSGQDTGFVINEDVAKLLQGYLGTSPSAEQLAFNPEAIPFIEFSRYSPLTRAPVNPFKSNNPNAAMDTTRSYKVMFDNDGDHQIMVTDPEVQPAWSSTNIVASVAVWTIIPATRKSDSSGQPEKVEEVPFGSWDSFSVK